MPPWACAGGRWRACLLAEPAAGPAGWPDAGLGRYGLACYRQLAGLWMAVAGFHGWQRLRLAVGLRWRAWLSRLGGYGGLAALCPAVAGVSAALPRRGAAL